ncbi:hypothetical protein SK128_023487, partial [Halocaridina rubra]
LNEVSDFDGKGYDNRGLVPEDFTQQTPQNPAARSIDRSYADTENVPAIPSSERAIYRNSSQAPHQVAIPRVVGVSRKPGGDDSRPASQHGSLHGYPAASRPAPDPDYDDPYSLERRGANVKRVTSGEMRR